MRIGIPVDPNDKVFSINKAYVSYVSEAGLDPILITPSNCPVETAEFCDGLLLPGGKDLDPIFYNMDNISSGGIDPDKDDFERQLLYAFGNTGKPIFGICRGFQLMVREYIHRKRKLCAHLIEFWQHISEHTQTTSLSVDRPHPSHMVHAMVSDLYGADTQKPKQIPVNSMHHQGAVVYITGNRFNIDITQHLTMLIWTTRGMPEGRTKNPLTHEFRTRVLMEACIIEGWLRSPLLGVQWHPEELKDYALIRSFFRKQKVREKVKQNDNSSRDNDPGTGAIQEQTALA